MIILISLDTFRVDHLGCYGYHRNTSPFIDAFAQESVGFEHSVVQSCKTLPSHMWIMTSLYPSFRQVTLKNQYLVDEHITLGELFLSYRVPSHQSSIHHQWCGKFLEICT